jgi:hypothetical protein
MPTHHVGSEHAAEDRTRFKNLIQNCHQQLAPMGLKPGEIAAVLDPAHELVDTPEFWLHQGEGLAVFAAPDAFEVFRLPEQVIESVTVAEGFHLKPLFPLLYADQGFWVLALSQHAIRLLRGSRFSVSEVELDEVPHSLSEALRYDDREPQLQNRASAKRGGRIVASFHGHGVGKDDNKTDVGRYFRMVDSGIREILGSSTEPMVLAGVDYLLPIYRQASDYANVLPDGVEGNPDRLASRELHDRAWRLVEPELTARGVEAAGVVRRHLANGVGSNSLVEVVKAAHHGRIDTIFVAVGEKRWGTYDERAGRAEVHDARWPGDEDLLNTATIATWMNGGKVFAVAPGEVPGGGDIAASFRF